MDWYTLHHPLLPDTQTVTIPAGSVAGFEDAGWLLVPDPPVTDLDPEAQDTGVHGPNDTPAEPDFPVA